MLYACQSNIKSEFWRYQTWSSWKREVKCLPSLFLDSLAPLLHPHRQDRTPPAPLNTQTDNAENILFLLTHYIKVWLAEKQLAISKLMHRCCGAAVSQSFSLISFIMSAEWMMATVCSTGWERSGLFGILFFNLY